jgi:hypothetical protein
MPKPEDRELESGITATSPAPPPDPHQALTAWFDTHIRDSAHARDTATLNTIHQALATIRQALDNTKS